MKIIGRWHVAQLTCVLVLIGMGGPRSVSADAVYQNSNPALISINNGSAVPYPSPITFSGVSGNITQMTLILHDISHTEPSHIDIMLEGPTGLNAVIMSDTGRGVPINAVTIALDDAAATPLPFSTTLVDGTSYIPTNYNDIPAVPDSFIPPAPVPSTNVALSTFNGTDPNGTWNLWIVDNVNGKNGSIGGGWTLIITTNAPAAAWNFPIADWDGDAVPDLVGIFKDQTGSGLTEVHVLSGASRLQEFIDHVATALPQTPENWEFTVADWDGDTVPDLVGIFKSQTGSGLTEVHVLSGASRLQSFIDQVATPLPQTASN